MCIPGNVAAMLAIISAACEYTHRIQTISMSCVVVLGYAPAVVLSYTARLNPHSSARNKCHQITPAECSTGLIPDQAYFQWFHIGANVQVRNTKLYFSAFPTLTFILL